MACGGRIYELPPPPADDARRSVTLDPAEERRLDAERYTEARRTVLGLMAALEGGDWASAVALLSQETRLLLSGGSGLDPAAALDAGRIGDESYAFDPVDLFVLRDISRFEDDWEGFEENETDRRKEIFLVTADEQVRRVIVIREGDAWVVHMPRWPRDLLHGGGA